MRAYDDACAVYEHARAAEIHNELYAIEDEQRHRRGDDNWRRTGLEAVGIEDLIERFKERAIAYEGADGTDETEQLYWDLKAAIDELKRRPGDQRRALFGLYSHPDIRIRGAAADATAKLAPLLSKHRQRHIDDENWLPPASGVDIDEVALSGVFPLRAHTSGRLANASVEALTREFSELGVAQFECQFRGRIAKYNRLHERIMAIADELKARDGDQRTSLVPLLTHENRQVRLMAAQCALAVAPSPSRQTLQELSDAKVYPQAAYAMGTLRALERGDRKPD